ncbi:hypothetical protein ACFQX6_05650 [Streptosporangium lutulentum]
MADEKNPDLFYLNEVYADLDAFNAHAAAPTSRRSSPKRAYAEGPTWLEGKPHRRQRHLSRTRRRHRREGE